MPVPPALSFKSLGYGVIKPSYFIFLAFSFSEDETIVYSVNGMVVDKEVDNRVVEQGVFKRVLLAKKLVIGFTKLLLLRTLITSHL